MRPTALLAFIISTAAVTAGDLFLTPLGAGDKTGSSWQNALDQGSANRAVNELLTAGVTLYLGSGTYQDLRIEVRRGGTENRPCAIKGVDRGGGLPLIRGRWTVEAPSKGPTAIRFAPGVSDLVISNLRIERFKIGVHLPDTPNATPHHRITFANVDMSHIRHGFYLSRCSNLRLEDCDLVHYTKHGFRFENACSRVRLLRCTADCSSGSEDWERRTELFPFGFIVNQSKDPQTDIHFVDCVARNNRMPLQNRKYKNGDGFVVEKSAAQVAFTRCRAIRNQDGGFDLKSSAVSLRDCVAVQNSRAFRIWSTASLSNCFAGFGTTGLWSNGGRIDVDRSTFYQLSGAAILADDDSTGPLCLTRSIIARCKLPARRTARGVIDVPPQTTRPGHDPFVFRAPAASWQGNTDAMDCTSHPDRGYSRPPSDTSRM